MQKSIAIPPITCEYTSNIGLIGYSMGAYGSVITAGGGVAEASTGI